MTAGLPAFWLGVHLLLGLFAPSLGSNPIKADDMHCFSRPSSCGYPDATNTGVPPGIKLIPSGSRRVTTEGAVLNGLQIRGTVTVAADNVTIENSRIIRTSGGSGTSAVVLDRGADGFTIKDSEVSGPRSNTDGLESAVWNHYNNPGARATRAYFQRCADCWEGAGSFHNDYMVVNSSYAGAHDEDIYVCSGNVNVDHSTLINRHQQTATVFGDTICGGGNNFKVTNSLLAGGGYLLYPQANSSAKVGKVEISGNRLARCRTKSVFEPSSGGTSCVKGADADGLFPQGGYYGVVSTLFTGPGQDWTDNIWADDSQPVCPNQRC